MNSRRQFLQAGAMALAPLALPISAADPKKTRVVVWDERQPKQKEAYSNFLGNAIADHLKVQKDFEVTSVALDDAEQGLADEVINSCEILVWWGHVRQAEIKPELGKRIVQRILKGQTSLIAIHSAHWATPFVEAMNERSRMDLISKLGEKTEIVEVAPEKKYTVPKYETRLTPYSKINKFPDGKIKAELHLPICCFPAYRGSGDPGTLVALKPEHPILEGIPREFVLPQTEMYNEPFHVPEPDEVILEERWATGEWFRSGMIWKLGKGRVFYFRPGHETYPIFQQELPLKIIENAARWLAVAQA